ncbi:hypothetical protein [Desulfoluna spongiiphila]|uniref:Uncharacterized protein n=1 Tax=Desulfoluna spongiiphila TaxID=419481 RepID=A0A1G5JP62_9BACT|nr:hypothetical protein [Desulfoluna spongiiphila]SCY89650.1 hypothetical protein SAMN05216233_13520 [Desulfoluna spongiiphila]
MSPDLSPQPATTHRLPGSAPVSQRLSMGAHGPGDERLPADPSHSPSRIDHGSATSCNPGTERCPFPAVHRDRHAASPTSEGALALIGTRPTHFRPGAAAH